MNEPTRTKTLQRFVLWGLGLLLTGLVVFFTQLSLTRKKWREQKALHRTVIDAQMQQDESLRSSIDPPQE